MGLLIVMDRFESLSNRLSSSTNDITGYVSVCQLRCTAVLLLSVVVAEIVFYLLSCSCLTRECSTRMIVLLRATAVHCSSSLHARSYTKGTLEG